MRRRCAADVRKQSDPRRPSRLHFVGIPLLEVYGMRSGLTWVSPPCKMGVSFESRWSPVSQHDHDHDHEHGDEEVIVLTDEEGNEHEFTIVQVIKVDEKDYAILLPLHGEEEAEEAVILRIDQEDGEDVLVEIEDEEEFERVAEAWEELLDEEEYEETEDK